MVLHASAPRNMVYKHLYHKHAFAVHTRRPLSTCEIRLGICWENTLGYFLSLSFETVSSRSSTPHSNTNSYIGLPNMGLDARKPVFGGLRTTKAQTSLGCAFWWAPLLFANWKLSYLDLLRANFNFLAGLCGSTGWFEPHFLGNPEDRIL